MCQKSKLSKSVQFQQTPGLQQKTRLQAYSRNAIYYNIIKGRMRLILSVRPHTSNAYISGHAVYTLWTIKGGSTFCDHNFGKSWWILIAFSLLHIWKQERLPICAAFYTMSTDSVLARFLCASRASCYKVTLSRYLGEADIFSYMFRNFPAEIVQKF